MRKSVPIRLFGFALLALASCQAKPDVKAECNYYGTNNRDFSIAASAALDAGQMGGMLMPELGGRSGRNGSDRDTRFLNAVAKSGMRVVNALDSFDAAKIERYKKEIGSKTFAIAPEDKDKFEGVQYLIVYGTGSERKMRPEHVGTKKNGDPIYRNRPYFHNSLDMKFWWIRGGDLIATVVAEGNYDTADNYSGMDDTVADALIRAGVPGTNTNVVRTTSRPGEPSEPGAK